MKFSLLLLSFLSSAAAFSTVTPKMSADKIDRSMKDVDETMAFDPTGGDAAALQRNNNDEVWVAQVRILGFTS